MISEKEALMLYHERNNRIKYGKIFYTVFNPNGLYPITKYIKHSKFFEAGSYATKRLFMAGNRVGKTEAACYEIACHAIGWYPSWWKGKRFPAGKNVEILASGDTNKTIRDIIQDKLLGLFNDQGSGFIPKEYLQGINRGHGVSELVDKIYVNRIGGGTTTIFLKPYSAGRETFQGVNADIIWLDEEPPHDIYTEALMRLVTTNGILMMTFTPLRSLTPLIIEFKKNALSDPRSTVVVEAGWDDVPHIPEDKKIEMLASIPEHERDARTKGIPSLGSGNIYRIPFEEIVIEAFDIPDHWRRAYALDVGWHTTACVFGAEDPETKIIYIYDELYMHQKKPEDYAKIIKLRGDLKGVVDSASMQSNQADGKKIFELLQREGLDIDIPDKSVEAGIYEVWKKLGEGRLRVFKSCKNLKEEYNLYRRDLRGNIIKEKDHLMDAMRYLIMGGMDRGVNKTHKNKNIHLQMLS